MSDRAHEIEYALKDGARIDGDPEVIGRELRLIEEKHGTLQPEAVVEEASQETSPLHPYFTWDDSEAARKHRKEEARKLVRSVTIKKVNREEPSGTTRAFVHVRDPEEGDGYQSTDVAMTEADKREQILGRAARDLQRFKDRYQHLSEFAGFMEEVQQKIEAIA